MNGPVTLSSLITPASSYDLVSLCDVKGDLNITSTVDDAYLQRRIDELSSAARQYMNRTLQVQMMRNSFFAQRDPYPWQLPGGDMPLQLTHWPIVGASARSSLPPPPAPILSAVAGGSLAATTYFVVLTYLTIEGETLPSTEASLAVGANEQLTIASPPAATDTAGRAAIGWNAYVGPTAGAEALQNGLAPLPLGAPFVLPAAALAAGVGPPPATVVNENGTQLIEGSDYLVDIGKGQLTRLFAVDLYPTRWSTLPISVTYSAGYPVIPPEIAGAVSRSVKGQYMGRLRDPYIKSQSAAGIYAATYLPLGDAAGPFTPDVLAVFDAYRVPVIA